MIPFVKSISLNYMDSSFSDTLLSFSDTLLLLRMAKTPDPWSQSRCLATFSNRRVALCKIVVRAGPFTKQYVVLFIYASLRFKLFPSMKSSLRDSVWLSQSSQWDQKPLSFTAGESKMNKEACNNLSGLTDNLLLLRYTF